MQPCGTVDGSAVLAKAAAPLLLRLLSKLVLEVLPAALASMIGAVLLAHYQFGRPVMPAGGVPAAVAASASAQMVRLVRDEHDLIRDFLMAQEAAQKSRYAAADAQSARAASDAELAAAATRRVASAMAAKPPASRRRPIAIAAISPAPPLTLVVPAVAPAAPAPRAVAGPQDDAAPAAAPEHGSLVTTTLAVKDHVVSATLHAVMAIGGIPSWIGHRLGSDDLDPGERTPSAAS